MPLPRLIPCLDVADGRVVKGVNFQNLRDVGDPVELGAAYSDAGADELVFLDITATLDKRAAAVATAARVAEQVTIPFTFGGGIRSIDDATAVLEADALDDTPVGDVEAGDQARERHRSRYRAPAGPLFSGWNCTPVNAPRSTTATISSERAVAYGVSAAYECAK